MQQISIHDLSTRTALQARRVLDTLQNGGVVSSRDFSDPGTGHDPHFHCMEMLVTRVFVDMARLCTPQQARKFDESFVRALVASAFNEVDEEADERFLEKEYGLDQWMDEHCRDYSRALVSAIFRGRILPTHHDGDADWDGFACHFDGHQPPVLFTVEVDHHAQTRHLRVARVSSSNG